MAQMLNAEQVKAVTVTTQGGRYSREAWANYLEDAAQTLIENGEIGAALTNVEQDFPGVKQVHVSHMFRLLLRTTSSELASQIGVLVDKDTEDGKGVMIVLRDMDDTESEEETDEDETDDEDETETDES
jgi:hypothetical protein